MPDNARKEQALLWRDDDLEGLEILHASYVTHSFARYAVSALPDENRKERESVL
jgi:hypothetical protein